MDYNNIIDLEIMADLMADYFEADESVAIEKEIENLRQIARYQFQRLDDRLEETLEEIFNLEDKYREIVGFESNVVLKPTTITRKP